MVREYEPTDLETIVRLFMRSVREVAKRDYSAVQISAWAPEPPDLTAWAHRLATGGTFVCERNDRIVGFARVEGTGCVDLLYVHPEVLRQGVARELLDAVMAWAENRGIPSLYAEVSLTARPFFERAGFRLVKPQVVARQGVPLTNFRMERPLDA